MKKLIVANWKMNPLTMEEARRLVMGIEHRMHLANKTEVVVCPPYVYLPPLSHFAQMTKLGAQNMAWADNGAFTGEISGKQMAQWGVEYVILGHSERRMYFGETDAYVNTKIQAALKNAIHPIVCLGGEPGAKKADMKKLVTKQFNAAVKTLDKKDIEKVTFVYEPIWAISTMKNSQPATGDHASELIEHIYALLAKKLGKDKPKQMRVLYGGTVNKNNVQEFSKFPLIGGALVGGASLDTENFWEIVKEFDREAIHKK